MVVSPSRGGVSQSLKAKGNFMSFPRGNIQVAFRLSFYSHAPEVSSVLGQWNSLLRFKVHPGWLEVQHLKVKARPISGE